MVRATVVDAFTVAPAVGDWVRITGLGGLVMVVVVGGSVVLVVGEVDEAGGGAVVAVVVVSVVSVSTEKQDQVSPTR